jgi:hypothetical protein
MQYGFVIPGGDFRTFGDLASEAEAAGWDGIFIPDAVSIEAKGFPASDWFDPWIALAVMAQQTQRIKLGPMIAAVPRRRPWQLAREVLTLDHLANGRMILPVGLGAAEDDGGFYKVGEAMELKVRAQKLDESLEIIAGLWRGKSFTFSGEHFKVQKMTMLPKPVQSPRIPIWVVGVWPKTKSMNRVLRYDGIVPQKYRENKNTFPSITLDDIRAIKQFIVEHRQEATPFDIVTEGTTPGKNRKKAVQQIHSLAEAGATWWMETMWAAPPGKNNVLTRIKQGPPRLD